MAVTTKKLFPATSNATTTVFNNVGIQLNNQDDLDVYVTLSGGTRVLQLRQSTGSTATSSHPQVNNTDGLYFPAVSVGTTLYNYTLSTDNNTITFNSALPQGAVVFCERRTRDADSSYTSFATGSTIRATDLNNSSTESNFTAQDGRNKALTIEGVLFRGDQPSTNFVTTDHIVAGTIVNNDIANDAINGDKIADDVINSEHYAAQSIDTEHIALENITTALIANDAVTTTKIADLNVTRGKLEADAVDSTKLADNAVNSEHYVDSSIDREHLSADIIDSTKLADNAVGSEHIQTNAITDSEIATGTLDNRYFTETELTNGALDGRYFTETESDARYFNVSTGDTIKDGDTFPDNDTTIATTAAINDRIIDLVDDVGGFVPIANETSFPTANPDVNNGTGTLVSIKEISSTRTPSSGTVTIANGSGSNTVTITGCGSTVLTAGFGAIVETTSTLHTYAFHRLTPKATEVTTVAGISGNVTTVAGIASNVTTVAGISSNVTTVAGNSSNVTTVANNIASVNNASTNINSIANYGDQYQVASSNPSTDGGGNDLAEGDLYFNTTANELKVYNGSQWQGGVTATGNFATVTGNTFTGANTYNDNVKAQFGTSADGLEIFHNASDSIINDAGTGDLKIQSGGSTKLKVTSSGAELTGNLDVSSGVDVTGNITVTGTVDGVDIAALNSTVSGLTTDVVSDTTPQLGGDLQSNGNDIDFADNDKATFGTGADLAIYHNGTDGYIDSTGNDTLLIRNGTTGGKIKIQGNSGEESIIANHDGSVELYHDGNKKLETTSTGVSVTGNLAITGTVDGIDIATDVAANTAKVTNATHTGEVTGATALTIADDVVDEANLKISNAGSNGQFLQKQSGNTGGLTWADAINFTTLSEHTGADANNNSAGDLIIEGTDTDSSGSVTDDDRTKYDKSLNTFNIGRNVNINIGFLNISTKTEATTANGGYVQQYSAKIGNSTGADIWLSSQGKRILIGTSDSLSHEVARFQTSASGASQHGFVHLNYVTANYGQNTSMQQRLATTATGMTFTGVIVPAADSTHDLGTDTVRWRNIYADTLYGDGSNLTGIASTTAGGAIYENSQTISASHTIPSGSNGMSAGPVTVNNGITLTISNGSTYTIV